MAIKYLVSASCLVLAGMKLLKLTTKQYALMTEAVE